MARGKRFGLCILRAGLLTGVVLVAILHLGLFFQAVVSFSESLDLQRSLSDLPHSISLSILVGNQMSYPCKCGLPPFTDQRYLTRHQKSCKAIKRRDAQTESLIRPTKKQRVDAPTRGAVGHRGLSVSRGRGGSTVRIIISKLI